MPQISRERLAAKLQQIPEGAREPYLRQLKERGYTWETRAAQEPSAARQFLEFAKEQGPQAVGAQIGSTMGTPFGMPGRVVGATVGGAGGKAWGITSEYLSGQRDPAADTASENAKRIGLAGLAEGGAEAGMGKLASWGKPLAENLGAPALKFFANIPEERGLAALTDPAMLGRAEPAAVSGAAYDAFEKAHGLENLREFLGRHEKMELPHKVGEKLVMRIKNLLEAGKKVGPQDLYLASQSAADLGRTPALMDPAAHKLATSASLDKAKKVIDAAAEEALPGYQALRQRKFESKVGEAFSHWLPKNPKGTTNITRPLAALAGSGMATAAGLPGIAGLAAISPKAWGALIRLLPSLGKAGKAGARVGAGVAGDTVAEELP